MSDDMLTPEEHKLLVHLAKDIQDIVAWHKNHAPALEKLIKEDLDRDDLVRDVKKKVFGWGALGVLTTVCAIIWFATKKYLGLD